MKIIRYVGGRGCRDEEYRRGLQDIGTTVIDPHSRRRNVTLQWTKDKHPLRMPLPDDLTDLVDLAMSVFIADELLAREESADGWTREFGLIVPVKEPDRWKAGEEALRRTLRFLSGDAFSFIWPERGALPPRTQHREKLPRGFDTVCLFSGGMDSLLGAHLLLAAGRKVLLVGHQAEPTTASAQRVLARQLDRLFPGQSVLVQCRVARARLDRPRFSLPDRAEDTHRPRSFLFLALAVAVARLAGIEDVYMPENGMIALNPPSQISRVGTHSTRTAHPIYLLRLLGFLEATALFSGSIRNPFLYLSKTDMLRDLPPELTPLVRRSVSCSHPFLYLDEGVRHCGYCVPCIHRRIAMMRCGLDDEQEYAFDVCSGRPSRLRGLALNRYKQADVRALMMLAERIVRSTNAELQLTVLSHGHFSPAVGGRIGPSVSQDYRPWVEMLQRWAEDFLAEMGSRSSPEMRHILGLRSPQNMRTV